MPFTPLTYWVKLALFSTVLAAIFSIVSLPAHAQENYYDSLNQRFIYLYTTRQINEAAKLADEVVPRLQAAYSTLDSNQLTTYYYAIIVYNIAAQNEKSQPNAALFASAVMKQFGKKSVKYCDALELIYESMRSPDPFKKILLIHEMRPLLQQMIYEGNAGNGFSGATLTRYDLRFRMMRITYTLAFAYANTSKYDSARYFLKDARGYMDDDYVLKHEPETFVNSYVGEASLLSMLDDLESAEEIYTETGKKLDQAGLQDNPLYAHFLKNKAVFYEQRLNKWQEASEFYEEAKRILEINFMDNDHDYPTITLPLANLYLKKQDYAAAQSLLDNSISRLEDRPVISSTFIRCWFLVQSFYRKKGDINNEAHAIKKMDDYFKTLGDSSHFSFNGVQSLKADLLTRQGRYEAADSLLNFIIAREARLNGNSSAYAGYLEQRAENYILNKKYAAAVQPLLASLDITRSFLLNYFSFLSEQQKQSYMANVNKGYALMMQLAVSTGSEEIIKQAFQLHSFIKGLLLQTSAITLNSGNRNTALYDQYALVKKNLATVYLSGEKDAMTALWEEQAETLEKQLAKLISKKTALVNADDVINQLKKEEAFIDFYTYRSDSMQVYGCFILDGNRKNVGIRELYTVSSHKANPVLGIAPAKPISKTLGVEEDEETRFQYKRLWQPIEASLGRMRKIYLSPAGELYRVSFAALADGEGQLLSDRYRITYVSSASSLRISNHTHSDLLPVYLYGGIDYETSILAESREDTVHSSVSFRGDLYRSEGWPFLPGTLEEVENISRQLPAGKYNLITGSHATESSIKSISGKQVAILHIASHGFFFNKKENLKNRKDFDALLRSNNDPLLRAGLLFAGSNHNWVGKKTGLREDGILTAYEISLMNLGTVKLAVLSACETALGDIQGSEGVYGLQRALKMAGVEYIIMSLRKVPDRETSEFMTLFYEKLFQNKDIENAFTETQQAMKEKYRDRPQNWASWILTK